MKQITERLKRKIVWKLLSNIWGKMEIENLGLAASLKTINIKDMMCTLVMAFDGEKLCKVLKNMLKS